jgi:hypothetical protein
MKANTIKLEEDILNEVNSVRPKNVTLAAFVRELIRKEISRRRLIVSAEAYEAFLLDHPEERGMLKDWESADLNS